MSEKWQNVYKKVVTVNETAAFALFFIPRYRNKMPLRTWVRLKFAEWLITPFLLTKDEVGDLKL